MPVLTPSLPRGIVFKGILLFILLSAPLRAETVIPREYQVKAVFLFNFAQFVQWPPKVFTRADEPFQIGILGEDPFGAFLDETVKGEKVDGHPLVIRRYASVKDVKKCQILFVSRSENDLADVMEGLKGRSVLTVGDSEGFVKNGGVVRFELKENKVHLKISLEAAKRGHLSISSKVLRLAEIADPEKD